MKPVLLPALLLLLSGCISYTYDIADRPPYNRFVLGEAVTTRELRLHKIKGTFREYSLSATIVHGPYPELIKICPPGTPVKIERIFREKGADGYLWDFVFGSTTVDGTPVEFETNLGLSDAPRPLPFKNP